MALITWSDALSVHVQEIDAQHQRLVAMINELDDAMRSGKGKELLGKIINGLAAYAVTHFSTEEKYFARFGYSDAENHTQEHASFIQKVSDFKEKFTTSRLSLTIEVMNFLSNWLKNHILNSDKKYSSFFNQNGLK